MTKPHEHPDDAAAAQSASHPSAFVPPAVEDANARPNLGAHRLMSRQLSSLRQVTSGTLGRNTIYMLFNQGGLIVIQGVYFLLLARYLGVSNYGAFAATAAV